MFSLIKVLRITFLLVVIFSLSSTFVYPGGGAAPAPPAPPPPPPPCPIKSAGCYKTGDVKAAFGELTLSDFGYYLPESKCIVGGCTCGGVPSNVVEQKDPDESSGACTCIAGAFWNTKGRCCGDDSGDCGTVASGFLCSIDANFASSTWIASSTNIGDIRYVGCSKEEFLSDGNTWIQCGGTFWKKTVGNSEYICIGKGRESIIECCGDGSCKSRVDGKRLSTGQSARPESYEGGIAAPDKKTYYCTPDRKFVTDLDVPNSQIDDKALISRHKSTCEKAGLAWTGTKCCSEADDPDEYYNDLGRKGGCWGKEPVISIDIVEDTNDSVINYNGEFHSCAIEKSNFNKDNDNLLEIVDQHTGGPLITDHQYCFSDPENNFYCSYNERWLPTDWADKTHFSPAPVPNQVQKGGCCAKEECWDGEKCIENQKSNPLAQPIANDFRCVDGEWVKSSLKSNFDSSASGYCPKQTQCLAKIFGREEDQCIESTEYIDDNYCENGNWSSRTKLLALKLLKLKSGDFTLFCDNRENTLNNLQYLTESNDVAANVLTNLQTNNFCVLKTGGKIIAATSINKDLEDIEPNALSILGIDDCDRALINDTEYHSCDETNKVWFNMNLKSFIYSVAAVSIPPENELPGSFEELVLSPVRSIIDSIKRLITKPPFDESYLKGIRKFDKLYMTQIGGRIIIGSMEGKDFKNAVIRYTGFDTDICNFVEQFSQAKKDASSGISCKKEGDSYYVLVQGSQFTSINPESIFPDLTSKLRLK